MTTEAVGSIPLHIHGIGTGSKIREYNVARLINTATRCVHIVGCNAYYHGSVLDAGMLKITGVSPAHSAPPIFCFYFIRHTHSVTRGIKYLYFTIFVKTVIRVCECLFGVFMLYSSQNCTVNKSFFLTFLCREWLREESTHMEVGCSVRVQVHART